MSFLREPEQLGSYRAAVLRSRQIRCGQGCQVKCSSVGRETLRFIWSLFVQTRFSGARFYNYIMLLYKYLYCFMCLFFCGLRDWPIATQVAVTTNPGRFAASRLYVTWYVPVFHPRYRSSGLEEGGRTRGGCRVMVHYLWQYRPKD